MKITTTFLFAFLFALLVTLMILSIVLQNYTNYIPFVILIILIIFIIAPVVNQLQFIYDNIMTILLTLSIIFFIILNVAGFNFHQFFLIVTVSGYAIIIIKGLLGAMKIASLNNSASQDSDYITKLGDNFKKYINNLRNAINNHFNFDVKLPEIYNNKDVLINTVMLFKEYLPFLLGSALVSFSIYLYRVTQLRVDLSLASNCKKQKYFVEKATIRNKIHYFANKYHDELRSSLILLLVGSLLTLLVISFIIYNNDIEMYYIWLIPILIFTIAFASIQIDYLDKNVFTPNDKYKAPLLN